MDELLIGLFGLLVVGVIVVAPLAAIYLVFDTRKRNAELQRRVTELEQRSARTDWWVGELSRRLDKLRNEGAPPSETTSETTRLSRHGLTAPVAPPAQATQESTSETTRIAAKQDARTDVTAMESPQSIAARAGVTMPDATTEEGATAGVTSVTAMETPQSIAQRAGMAGDALLESSTSVTGMQSPRAIAAFHDAPTIPAAKETPEGDKDDASEDETSAGSTSTTGMQTPRAIARAMRHASPRSHESGMSHSHSDRDGDVVTSAPAEGPTSSTGMETPAARGRAGSGRHAEEEEEEVTTVITTPAGLRSGSVRPAPGSGRHTTSESPTSATGMETPAARGRTGSGRPAGGESPTSVTGVETPAARARSGSGRPGAGSGRPADGSAEPGGNLFGSNDGAPPYPPGAAAAGGPGSPAPAIAAMQAFDLEKLVGVRLFAWLGGLGLFIGAAFFLEYSIEHELISPPARIGIGLVAGAIAVLVGDILRDKADRAGQALGGAGIATLYASLFAARTLYELLPTPAAFGAMVFVTALAGAIAVRRDAFVLAVIALVGGFSTPVLLSTGEDHRYALFGYLALLDAGVLYVASRRHWISLTALGFVATAIIYAGWASEYLDQGGVPFALGTAALFAALFAFGTLKPAATTEPSKPVKTALRSGLFGCALAAPFIAAICVGAPLDFHASPILLAGYLCVLLGSTFVLSEKWGAPFSLEIGAGLTVLALTARAAPDILGEEAPATFFAFSLPAALLLGLALWKHASGNAVSAASPRRAAAILLGGSWLVVGQMFPAAEFSAPIAPFGLYVAAHAAGFIALGLFLSASRWLAAAHALWIATLLTITQQYEVTRLDEFVPFIVVPMFVFFALPIVTARAQRPAGWISGALALVSHFAILYGLARTAWSDLSLGAGAVAAGGAALGMLSFARPKVSSDTPSGIIATLGAVTLAFLTAAVPIALSKQWITVAWGLEAAALAWLYLRVAHKGLLVASALMALSTLVRLVANPSLWEYHPRSGVIVFNWYLYTFGLPALAFFATAHLLQKDQAALRYRYPMLLWFAGGAIIFVLLNVEIADAYSTGQTIGFHMGASLGEDMTYSLGWGVFGLATLVIGMVTRVTRARLSALAVLLLTIGKVFLHDLWHLGALYRVGSMVGLAMALLAVSFLTQRFILRGDRS